MKVKKFMLAGLESNVFVASCTQTRAALMIDCGEFRRDMEEYIAREGLRLAAIFITHDHHDHTEGLPAALQQFDVPVYASKERIGERQTKRVAHGDSLTVGTLTGKVVATPGHTPDGLSLIFEGGVFTGDALFAGSVGGTSSPELAEQQLKHIRNNIFSLPQSYRLHVGHGPSTTVEIEQNYNPFFV